MAVALHEPQLGGATLSLLRVLPRLEEREWRFTFWVPGRGDAERELRRRGYEVGSAERLLRFSVKGFLDPPGPAARVTGVPAYLRTWRRWLAAQNPGLVHANSLLALPEAISRPRGGPPLVLHTHEVVPPGLKGAVAARLARRADAVVSVSEAAAAALRGHGVPSTVVYEAVPELKGVVRSPRSGERLVVGTIGTISKRKGSDLFLEAAKHLVQRHDGLEFRMIGAPVVGAERAWALDLLKAARAAGIGHAEGVTPFAELADWDIFVLPSRMDPCPLAVFEAMAMGLPVVGADVGGIPEQLGRDAGLLVPAEDVEALVQVVLRLAGSAELRRSLGEAARERVQRLFSLERQADGLDRVYRQLVRA